MTLETPLWWSYHWRPFIKMFVRMLTLNDIGNTFVMVLSLKTLHQNVCEDADIKWHWQHLSDGLVIVLRMLTLNVIGNTFVMVLSLKTAVTAGYQDVIRVSSVFSHSDKRSTSWPLRWRRYQRWCSQRTSRGRWRRPWSACSPPSWCSSGGLCRFPRCSWFLCQYNLILFIF